MLASHLSQFVRAGQLGNYLLFGSLSGLTMLGFLLDHGCTGGAVDEYLGLLVGCDYGKVLLAVGQACGF